MQVAHPLTARKDRADIRCDQRIGQGCVKFGFTRPQFEHVAKNCNPPPARPGLAPSIDWPR